MNRYTCNPRRRLTSSELLKIRGPGNPVTLGGLQGSLSGSAYPEGPYIQLLENSAPKYHTIEGIVGPNSLTVVYVDPLGKG